MRKVKYLNIKMTKISWRKIKETVITGVMLFGPLLMMQYLWVGHIGIR
jgi:hypothetical protein